MFSAGKTVAAIVVAMLVDKGLLEYDKKIQDYWPEFGKNGKNDITLADVLRHESGLQNFNHAFTASDISRESIKANVIGKIVEDLVPLWPTKELGVVGPDGSETRRAYHAFTRGWLLNEVVRRVDPEHRTIGEIMQAEIGIDGLRCGISDSELDNTTKLTAKSLSWLLFQGLIPKGNPAASKKQRQFF